MGVPIVLMFILWNLLYLALALAVVWVLFIIATFIFTWKPLMNFRKTRAYILGREEKKE